MGNHKRQPKIEETPQEEILCFVCNQVVEPGFGVIAKSAEGKDLVCCSQSHANHVAVMIEEEAKRVAPEPEE